MKTIARLFDAEIIPMSMVDLSTSCAFIFSKEKSSTKAAFVLKIRLYKINSNKVELIS